ncbi:YggS family pyridoxal phosphate-dependent enzyme [Solimonas sp. K1W22B-7]|uniref:YggS family pyridoxal phosphate-dependent enzyme n=1 Tax=Solimonas sp. K1W22B-7 TaxID=2303331 RepID=UPI000E3361B3|nr:YggS family pyridoxal phosphate-dependent enzyme [Solimonas sp. K1W22B-7]AXQ30305.1 YggS family pyridoxal phosphate-dependent enzyme [Solimonas sp. K1W22B-7]
MANIPYNLARVQARIEAACKAAGRPENAARLLAVSKTFDAEAVRVAHAAGQFGFGENYLQEALDKQAALADLPLEWHFIGPVQSNKTRSLAERFDWVHGVERLKIAQRLSDQRPEGRAPLNVCVQVNVSGEASKSGCAPAEVLELCATVARLPRLRLRGLMAIPAPAVAATDRRAPFRQLRELFGELRRAGLEVDTISAGMSDDLEDAIAEGATIVRVGTSIFGKRTP